MKLFIYGELQKSEIQKKYFGEELKGTIDSITNWVILNDFENGVNYLQLASHPEGIVFGKILDLTNEQIDILDKYEKDYFRCTIKTDSGVIVETYIKDNDKIEKKY